MKRHLFILPILILSMSVVFGQEVIRNTPEGGYLFTIEHNQGATAVKNQGSSGTCWSFSTLSFFESELIRKGKGEFDLSEMYIVRHTYPQKAELYVRMHGNANFSPGGLFRDVLNVQDQFGLVPESVYSGKTIRPDRHTHIEMDRVLLSMVESFTSDNMKGLTPKWKEVIGSVLDVYLGEIPQEFEYKGKPYTPISFAEELGLKSEDYIELSSFTHHPYYQSFVLEVPDNWDWSRVYNLPLDELEATVDYALQNGHTVAWDTDVSEKYFSHGKAVAVVPQEGRTVPQEPGPEKEITPELRQKGFDQFSTTDDHLMHIVGMAKDQKGSPYYIVKNSWGQSSNQCGGYVYVSKPYFRYKTIHVMIHKDALPADTRQKLGL
ncbi:MAG: C1 family peptidase [Bacteroidota bacterium]